MRKRTHTRGVAIAVAVKWLGVFLVAYFGAELTRYASDALRTANPLSTGPFPLYSLGWYATQVAAAFVGFVAGGVCVYFAPPSTWRAPAILISLYFALGLVSVPESAGLAFSAYWILFGPVTLWSGVWSVKRLERGAGAA